MGECMIVVHGNVIQHQLEPVRLTCVLDDGASGMIYKPTHPPIPSHLLRGRVKKLSASLSSGTYATTYIAVGGGGDSKVPAQWVGK